jgi:hypothetical protein
MNEGMIDEERKEEREVRSIDQRKERGKGRVEQKKRRV